MAPDSGSRGKTLYLRCCACCQNCYCAFRTANSCFGLDHFFPRCDLRISILCVSIIQILTGCTFGILAAVMFAVAVYNSLPGHESQPTPKSAAVDSNANAANGIVFGLVVYQGLRWVFTAVVGFIGFGASVRSNAVRTYSPNVLRTSSVYLFCCWIILLTDVNPFAWNIQSWQSRATAALSAAGSAPVLLDAYIVYLAWSFHRKLHQQQKGVFYGKPVMHSQRKPDHILTLDHVGALVLHNDHEPGSPAPHSPPMAQYMTDHLDQHNPLSHITVYPTHFTLPENRGPGTFSVADSMYAGSPGRNGQQAQHHHVPPTIASSMKGVSVHEVVHEEAGKQGRVWGNPPELVIQLPRKPWMLQRQEVVVSLGAAQVWAEREAAAAVPEAPVMEFQVIKPKNPPDGLFSADDLGLGQHYSDDAHAGGLPSSDAVSRAPPTSIPSTPSRHADHHADWYSPSRPGADQPCGLHFQGGFVTGRVRRDSSGVSAGGDDDVGFDSEMDPDLDEMIRQHSITPAGSTCSTTIIHPTASPSPQSTSLFSRGRTKHRSPKSPAALYGQWAKAMQSAASGAVSALTKPDKASRALRRGGGGSTGQLARDDPTGLALAHRDLSATSLPGLPPGKYSSHSALHHHLAASAPTDSHHSPPGTPSSRSSYSYRPTDTGLQLPSFLAASPRPGGPLLPVQEISLAQDLASPDSSHSFATNTASKAQAPASDGQMGIADEQPQPVGWVSWGWSLIKHVPTLIGWTQAPPSDDPSQPTGAFDLDQPQVVLKVGAADAPQTPNASWYQHQASPPYAPSPFLPTDASSTTTTPAPPHRLPPALPLHLSMTQDDMSFHPSHSHGQTNSLYERSEPAMSGLLEPALLTRLSRGRSFDKPKPTALALNLPRQASDGEPLLPASNHLPSTSEIQPLFTDQTGDERTSWQPARRPPGLLIPQGSADRFVAGAPPAGLATAQPRPLSRMAPAARLHDPPLTSTAAASHLYHSEWAPTGDMLRPPMTSKASKSNRGKAFISSAYSKLFPKSSSQSELTSLDESKSQAATSNAVNNKRLKPLQLMLDANISTPGPGSIAGESEFSPRSKRNGPGFMSVSRPGQSLTQPNSPQAQHQQAQQDPVPPTPSCVFMLKGGATCKPPQASRSGGGGGGGGGVEMSSMQPHITSFGGLKLDSIVHAPHHNASLPPLPPVPSRRVSLETHAHPPQGHHTAQFEPHASPRVGRTSHANNPFSQQPSTRPTSLAVPPTPHYPAHAVESGALTSRPPMRRLIDVGTASTRFRQPPPPPPLPLPSEPTGPQLQIRRLRAHVGGTKETAPTDDTAVCLQLTRMLADIQAADAADAVSGQPPSTPGSASGAVTHPAPTNTSAAAAAAVAAVDGRVSPRLRKPAPHPFAFTKPSSQAPSDQPVFDFRRGQQSYSGLAGNSHQEDVLVSSKSVLPTRPTGGFTMSRQVSYNRTSDRSQSIQTEASRDSRNAG